MNFDNLTPANYLLYASKNYHNPTAESVAEFREDLDRIKYINRLLHRYLESKEDLKEKLILNHLMTFFNVFGSASTRLLFLKIDYECWSLLKTFLLFMDRMPIVVYGINGVNIISQDLPRCEEILTVLIELLPEKEKKLLSK